MRKIILSSLLAVLSLTVNAQNDNREGQQDRMSKIDMTEMYNRQANETFKTLKLKKDLKDSFTALYLDWQANRFNAMNPNGQMRTPREEQPDFKNMTDEEAEQYVKESFEKRAKQNAENFERQNKQLDVDKEFYPKFLQILTPAQAAQLFGQIRNGFSMNGVNGMNNMRGGMGGFRGGMGGPGGMGGFRGGMGGPGGF